MNKYIIIVVVLTFFSCSKKSVTIGIQPYGDIDLEILTTITEALKTNYQSTVIVLEKKAIPPHAFVTFKSPRYRADSLLIDLLKQRPDSIDYIIGITAEDISTTKRNANGDVKLPASKYSDWGIFGLGYKPGKSCVVSTFRLKNTKTSVFKSRLQKISVHEIGHNMGLNHCTTNKCVMQDAVESIKTVDLANFELCNKCYNDI